MNITEFKALVDDGDLTRVVISHYRDSYMAVSAILRCDNESKGLTAYNFLRDGDGQLLKFDNIHDVEKVIRDYGYQGPISIRGATEKTAETG